MTTILEKSIGSGPLFPIILENGSWNPVVGDPRLITDNLRSILLYQVGFRIRQEIFGTRLVECLEEPNTNLTRLLVYRFVKESIQAWEPRIILKTIDVKSTVEKIDVNITYQIVKTQLVQELDFSFQKQ